MFPFPGSKYRSHSLTGCYGDLQLLKKLQRETNAASSHPQNQALSMTNIGTDSRTQIIL